MPKKKKTSPRGAKIEKPEDKAWREWYENLDEGENKRLLMQLGLDESEIEKLKEMHGNSELIEEAFGGGEEKPLKASRKTKKKKEQ